MSTLVLIVMFLGLQDTAGLLELRCWAATPAAWWGLMSNAFFVNKLQWPNIVKEPTTFPQGSQNFQDDMSAFGIRSSPQLKNQDFRHVQVCQCFPRTVWRHTWRKTNKLTIHPFSKPAEFPFGGWTQCQWLRAGFTHNSSPVHHRATHRQTTKQTYT